MSPPRASAPPAAASHGRLLERHDALAGLDQALADAARARGRIVLVGAEAGLGKTSLVRAFLAGAAARARVLHGSCDDLLTPRTLGPVHDMARHGAAALRSALADGQTQPVFEALLDELHSAPPTVLVVEDLHWADEATLDVLALLARRLEQVPAMLLLTYREDETSTGSPLRRLLGTVPPALAVRVTLAPLSLAAVIGLAGERSVALRVHSVTAGNPFLVTELLAAWAEDPDGEDARLPRSVGDAVLGRVAALPAPTRALLDEIAVVPTAADTALLDELHPGWTSDAVPAEERGIVRLHDGALAFRHELARLAVAGALPGARRRALDRAVLAVLLRRDPPDRARALHHAGQCADVGTILSHGPAAAREAAAAGAHQQALAHYTQVLPHVDRLPPEERAALHEEHAWELYNAHRFPDAVAAGRRAVEIREEVGEPAGLGHALVTLSRHLYMNVDTAGAHAAVGRAVHLLEPGPRAGLALARTHRGVLLVLDDQEEEGLAELSRAQEIAAEVGARDLVALCLNYRGLGSVFLGDEDGVALLRRSITEATTAGHREYEVRGYTSLSKALRRLGRDAEVQRCVDEGLARSTQADLRSHAYSLRAHRHQIAAARGDWDTAEAGLREMVVAVPDAGVLARETLPALARLLVRRGDPDATVQLERAWELAMRAGTLAVLVPAGLAAIERAWLDGEPERSREHAEILLARTDRRGAARYRGELLRYLRRAGWSVGPFDGCPEEYAAGLRGDWAGAAAAWQQIGDPYERALELAGSGRVEPTLQALRLLDGLGAEPAAQLVRRTLRALGVQRIPRGPLPGTRRNPAGLTERQLDVLGMLAEGRTNAEIARQLVVSVRTVDHHVSAVLAKLGVRTRQEAARAARAAAGDGQPTGSV